MDILWWTRATVVTSFLSGLVGSVAIMVMWLTAPEPAWWIDILLPFAGIYLWLTPFGIALIRGHKHSGPIGMLNLLLGLTGIGWIVALIWSCTEWTKTTR